MVSSSDLKIPQPPPLAPFAKGGTPGQNAFLTQQAAIDKQVVLNKTLAGGKKFNGGALAAINVQTVPNTYPSVYGPGFNEQLQLQNAGTAGQAQLYAKYDSYATVKGGKRRRKTSKSRKRMTSKKRKTNRIRRRTYKK